MLEQQMSVEVTLLKDGFLLYPIKGNSMYPQLIEKTDLVRIESIKGDLNIGDIVLFKRGEGHYVLHRIVSCRNGLYTIQGDNVGYIDFDIPRESIYGILTGVIREGIYSPLDEHENEQFFQNAKKRYKGKRFLCKIKYKIQKLWKGK